MSANQAMRPRDVDRWLRRGLNSYQTRLDGRALGELAAGFRAWQRRGGASDADFTAGADAPLAGPLALTRYLQDEVRTQEERFAELRGRQAEFDRRYARAVTDGERTEHVLEFARDLGASAWRLRGDRRAFGRWFGADAVSERRSRRQAEAERRMALCLERLGAVAGEVLRAAAEPRKTWDRLGLEALARPLLVHPGDARVATAAFRCLSTALRGLPAGQGEGAVDDATLTVIYRAALDPAGPVWVQCEALDLLAHLSAENFRKVLEARLARPATGDDIFVRRRAVRLIGEHLARLPALAELLPKAAADPSPFVRQAAVRALTAAPPEVSAALLRKLALDDPAKVVRAAVLVDWLAALAPGGQSSGLLGVLAEVMRQEQDPFVLRVAAHVAAEGSAVLSAEDSGDATRWRATVTAELDHLRLTAASPAVRRWAALARERVWCDGDPAARALRDGLRRCVSGLKPGKRARVPLRLLRGHDEATVGRVLAVLTQDDFGLDLEWGWFGAWVTRGPVFKFRLWRFLHEVRHPDPAKRQAFRHTIGRASDAFIRAPSAILSELAETKVPGEPLFLATEGGWRPYLPLPDDALSAVNQVAFPRPVRFYTADGVTELAPPRTPWGRLAAWWRLTRSFAKYARMRNWREGDPTDPSTYLRELGRLGFRVSFRPHAEGGTGRRSEPEPDTSVGRFFPALAVLPPGVAEGPPGGWEGLPGSFAEYFQSLYANSVTDLWIFAAVGLAFFLGKHWYLNATMRRARNSLPLVLGGWGTRGKSGTERLKAALISALGYGYVCKTTGCEAMILHADPYGKTRELFLYRSYDKATIWEQRMVVRTAVRLRAEVFLWECMGLNPTYVEILQRQWMRDDASTITNTYPDHEDIQGPAGINIPQVMTRFIPRGSRLVTSEEQMRPILLDAADRLGTEVRSVGWLEAGLLAPDALARFPYEEHPYNIALVLALAESLGLDRDFCLKEMADRVVPDLGVLKTTAPAPLRTRKLEFSNGMSANERHGCVTNWTRLGFDRQDPEAEPGVWITTVVNNRADRIPRSRVFAGVLVNDLSADRHVLIGGNLSGLLSYIREAWDESAPRLTLWPEGAGPADPAEVFAAAAKRFRVPFTEQMLAERLRAMLAGVGAAIDPAELGDESEAMRKRLAEAGVSEELAGEVAAFVEQDRKAFAEYRAFAERLRGSTDRAELDRAYRDLLWTWFQRKLVVVHDYHATGEQIIDRICRETPPGFRNRVMGIQNIKGTGLDFVYRWEAWHACHAACALMRSDDPLTAERGLRDLAGFQDFGVVSEEYVRETVALVRQKPFAQKEAFQAQLDLVTSNLEAKMATIRQSLKGGGAKKAGWLDKLASLAEGVLDAGDAVRRRRWADQIYRDLAAERISHERAALELQKLTSRQKGGWLRKKLAKWRAALTDRGTH